jgi:hypothetical protein
LGCGVVAAYAVAGCATSGYDPGRIQSELVKAGTTREQAQCVTKRLSDTFDERQLGSYSDPNAVRDKDHPRNEYDRTRDILVKCGVTLPLNSLP